MKEGGHMEKKTIRNTLQIEACIKAIGKKVPGIKESEIVNYSYRVMAQDFRGGLITGRIWDEIPKYQFKDDEIPFPETRAIMYEDEDYDTVVLGRKDPENTYAYMKRDGISRASFAYVTKFVLMYVRKKLEEEDKQPAISSARRDTTVEDRLDLLHSIMTIMKNYDERSIEKLKRIKAIVEED